MREVCLWVTVPSPARPGQLSAWDVDIQAYDKVIPFMMAAVTASRLGQMLCPPGRADPPS